MFHTVEMLSTVLSGYFLPCQPFKCFSELSILAMLPYLSFLCFNLGKIVLCVCDILEF